MDLLLQPKPVIVRFSIDHPATGFIQLHFSEVVCIRKAFPAEFDSEQPRKFDLREARDAVFSIGDSTIVRSLVASLIKDGNTGVKRVVIPTSKVVKIFYNPKKRPPHLFKLDVKDILRDKYRHGWPVHINW